ncbi:MAG TPA: hypothetical protein DCZ49_00150 [Hyphomonadaceae bacterium]|nr:hypothetical protein [Hyphomonadaceae bacterium]
MNSRQIASLRAVFFGKSWPIAVLSLGLVACETTIAAPPPASTTPPPRISGARPPTERPVLQPAPSDARALIGLTADEAQERLGPPLIIRHEGAAQLWTYSIDACALALVLAPTPRTPGALRVVDAHLSPRIAGGAPTALDVCLAAQQRPGASGQR